MVKVLNKKNTNKENNKSENQIKKSKTLLKKNKHTKKRGTNKKMITRFDTKIKHGQNLQKPMSLIPNTNDQKIVVQQPIFAKKHPQCEEVSKFYSVLGQINLVLHGVPFHLIEDKFVRFHAVQSTIIGWKLTIFYLLIVLSSIANLMLFDGRYLDWIGYILAVGIVLHIVVNFYLKIKTKNCEQISIPILTNMVEDICAQ